MTNDIVLSVRGAKQPPEGGSFETTSHLTGIDDFAAWPEASALVRSLEGRGNELVIEWDLQAERRKSAEEFATAKHQARFAEACRWLAGVARAFGPAEVRLSPRSLVHDPEWEHYIPMLTVLPLEAASSAPAARPGTWDSLVDPWVDYLPSHGNKTPSAYRIWLAFNRYLRAGDLERARRCEELNYVLHNSYVPAALELEGEIVFAYGGIGVILHKDAHIRPGAVIGANVTVGGSGSAVRIDARTGRSSTVPEIGELVTIGACANISGGVVIGAMAIIAPNSVVTKSVLPGQIVAGAPARVIGQVTPDNASRYKVKYLMARSWTDEKYAEFAARHLPESKISIEE